MREARRSAQTALDGAGIEVCELTTNEGLTQLGTVIDRVWRRSTPMIEHGLLKAFVEAGGYVVGAHVAGRMVGGAVGFLGRTRGEPVLHSHVAGFLDEHVGAGRGRALKLHQRAWCLDRGIGLVAWTFDPLVARNAWFNLHRLGADLERYSVDHYGSLRDDGVNGTDESDRWVVHWHLDGEAATALAQGGDNSPDEAALRAAGAAEVLDGRGRPTGADPDVALVPVPPDVVALRTDDPEAARRWRRSTREAITERLAAGQRVRGFTRSGCYVFGAS